MFLIDSLNLTLHVFHRRSKSYVACFPQTLQVLRQIFLSRRHAAAFESDSPEASHLGHATHRQQRQASQCNVAITEFASSERRRSVYKADGWVAMINKSLLCLHGWRVRNNKQRGYHWVREQRAKEECLHGWRVRGNEWIQINKSL